MVVMVICGSGCCCPGISGWMKRDNERGGEVDLMKCTVVDDGVIEMTPESHDVSAPTKRMLDFVMSTGDRDFSDAIQIGAFQRCLRQTLGVV